MTLKIWKSYESNISGQFGMFFALLALPVLLCISYALDYTYAIKQQTGLEAALDAAVIAAVNKTQLSPSEREAFAKAYFFDNYDLKMNVSLQSSATSERVELIAKGNSPLSFGAAAGLPQITISSKSAAEIATSNVVCVLALDPSSSRAIEFKDNAELHAPACAVQANSRSQEALFSSSNSMITAKSFCSSGGSKGKFNGVVKNECNAIGDPYANLTIPTTSQPCSAVKTVKTTSQLYPDNFCEGLKIDGANVTFAPGVYYIGKELLFTANSQVKGTDVTFVLYGTDASLKIDNDAIVSLKAPKTGVSKGLVFWQSPLAPGKTNNSTAYATSPDATGKSEISASGNLRIVGTAYFPTQELVISSDKKTTSSSPATSFIAYRVQFAGDSASTVRVDHETGGIPPLLPRSDDGARLVR